MNCIASSGENGKAPPLLGGSEEDCDMGSTPQEAMWPKSVLCRGVFDIILGMTELGATLRARLDAAVGAAHVLTTPAATEPYLVDWRGRYHGRALAVVRPGSTGEVSAVVRACVEAGIPIVPQGGNTGMCGGATPDESGHEVVVALGRMNRVRSVDRDNATIVVEAGVPLAGVQAAAAAAGLLFPLSLGSEGSCTIGGNLSTNAGGTAVLRFGNARDLVLGLEVVLPDGTLWDGLRGLRKDNTGYDLKQLFVGAEGTLGIITAAVLKLFPAPAHRVTALAAVPDPRRAVALLRSLKGSLGDRLVGFELISGIALRLCRKHHPDLPDPLPDHAWYTLVQADDSSAGSNLRDQVEAALADAIEAGTALDVALAAIRGAGALALGLAREHLRGAAPRRPQHQARRIPARLRDPGVPARLRSRTARRLSRDAARHLRAPRGRQPALQRGRAARARAGRNSWPNRPP